MCISIWLSLGVCKAWPKLGGKIKMIDFRAVDSDYHDNAYQDMWPVRECYKYD